MDRAFYVYITTLAAFKMCIRDRVTAMEDPLDFMAVEAVRTAARRKVIPVLATREGIRRAYNLLYEAQGAQKAIERCV